MNAKLGLALVALVSVGVFALPSTVALFAGQHGFVNIDPTGNQISCEKCHGDIQAELQSEHSTATGTDGPHAAMKCEFCHRLQIGLSSGDSAYAIVEYTGTALNSTGASVTARRWLVMKTADYEAQKYPDTINGTVNTLGTLATAGASLSTLYNPDGLWNYSATVFAWNVSGRARQTDIIENGIGKVTFVPRATVLPLYENGAPIDTNDLTKNSAFNPALVTWNTSAVTGPTSQPAVVLDGAGSRTVNAGSRYHAASLVACMDCHAGSSPQPGHETSRLGETNSSDVTYCAQCHYGTELPGDIRTYQLSAGGFGGITSETFDNGSAEVHKDFVKNDPNNPNIGVFGGRVQPASNAACIACHTHVAVDISYTRPSTLKFDANEGTDGAWFPGGYTATGSAVTHSNDTTSPP
ncbi:MAG: hypothetical protein O8C64_12550 [Candidatus Methanoperedens sp.]|nr:hypothetical protein [Candidatus Methanoperedens sp.]MCZ7405674.1 hypothetical protein [Candidatus Methanoperedens sp.]